MTKGIMKSVLAIAALSSLVGVVRADDASSLTIYGRIDEAFNKAIGYTGKQVNTISGPYNSRLGFTGSENLGDGWKGVFNLEHRFNPDTGTQYKTNTFWFGRAVVGLDSPYGRVLLGREYTPIYTTVAGPASPWGTDSLATTKVVTLGGVGSTTTVDPQRMNKSINYLFSADGFTFQAQAAGRTNNNGSADDLSNSTGDNKKHPFGLGASYAAGPLYVGLGYTNPSDSKDKWTAGVVSYNFDVAKVGVALGTGRVSSTIATVGGDKERSWDLFATVPAGTGEFRFAYGQLKDKDAGFTVRKPLSLGYYYNMSKRTHLYADYLHDNAAKVAYNKNGYEVGIRHDF